MNNDADYANGNPPVSSDAYYDPELAREQYVSNQLTNVKNSFVSLSLSLSLSDHALIIGIDLLRIHCPRYIHP